MDGWVAGAHSFLLWGEPGRRWVGGSEEWVWALFVCCEAVALRDGDSIRGGVKAHFVRLLSARQKPCTFKAVQFFRKLFCGAQNGTRRVLWGESRAESYGRAGGGGTSFLLWGEPGRRWVGGSEEWVWALFAGCGGVPLQNGDWIRHLQNRDSIRHLQNRDSIRHFAP
jgi:hypothetical protein